MVVVGSCFETISSGLTLFVNFRKYLSLKYFVTTLKLITFVHKFLSNCQKGAKDSFLLYPSKILENIFFESAT